MRILLIDDSSEYQEEFRALLAEGAFADAEIDCVSSARDGAKLMHLSKHDVYFVDYRLPGDSGIELIRRARAAGVTRPIICLTGYDSPKLDLAAEEAGANAYLPKGGFSVVTLSRTIRYALRNITHVPMSRDVERRFALAQVAVSIGTWEWDIRTGEMTWDSRMYRLFGCEPRPDLPAYEVWRRGMHPAALNHVEQAMRESIATGKGFNADFTIVWDDGSQHFIRAAGHVIRNADGEAVRMVGINWDITDVRQLVADLALARDDAQRATATKSRFLAGISHELRTPLNGILGCAHLLRLEGGLTAQQDVRVGAMLVAGAHLLDLINRVLDLSSIEAANGELHAVDVQPRTLAEACLELMRPAAAAKFLALRLQVAPDAPTLVRTDPTRLRQVLLNLLGNAIKFTPSGSVTLSVTKAGETAWRLDVVDTGPGIPPDQTQNLFVPYERLATAATQAVEGAGLGLALVDGLATLLCGKLGYEANPGGGSRFWIELPNDVIGAGPSQPAAPAASHKLSARRLRILIVDDMAMNREIAQAFLLQANHDVTSVATGAEAIAAVAAQPFDVVLMDISMPDMDGLEATRRIRALSPPASQVPIIALTAHAFAEQLEECRQAGMDHHLSKPFTPDALQDAVLRAADASQPVRDTIASTISQAVAV